MKGNILYDESCDTLFPFFVTGFLITPNATQGNDCRLCKMHCFITYLTYLMLYLSFDIIYICILRNESCGLIFILEFILYN